MTLEKRLSLHSYANNLKQRLPAPVPTKHQNKQEAYKQMLEIDLKKTLAKLAGEQNMRLKVGDKVRVLDKEFLRQYEDIVYTITIVSPTIDEATIMVPSKYQMARSAFWVAPFHCFKLVSNTNNPVYIPALNNWFTHIREGE